LIIDASEQHHSRGRASLSRRRGHCHRLWHGLAGCPRYLEPPGQLSHRIRIDGCFVHDNSLLARWWRRWVSWHDERLAEWRTFYSYVADTARWSAKRLRVIGQTANSNSARSVN
jgi:hypothetical protein